MKRLVSTVLTLGLVVAATAALAMPAQAHEAEKSMKATDLVRQCIALIVNEPDKHDMALDKMNDALNSKFQSGVYVDYILQAVTAEKAGDSHRARALLEASIGAKPHISGVDPAPIRQLSVQPAVGAEAGVGIATDPMELTAEFTGTNLALLAASVIAIALGAWMAIRIRPRHRQANL